MRTLKGRSDGTQGMTAWSPGNPRREYDSLSKTAIPRVGGGGRKCQMYEPLLLKICQSFNYTFNNKQLTAYKQ